MDKERREFIKENNKLVRFVESEEWTYVKGLLMEKINDMQSIMNLEGTLTPEEIILDIKTRRGVVEELVRWVKEVEGKVEQYLANDVNDSLKEKSYILRED